MEIRFMKDRVATLVIVLLSLHPVHAQKTIVARAATSSSRGCRRSRCTLAEQVKRYTEFRSAALLDWHPTRREMLIATRFAQTAQVHRVKTPGGAARS